MDAELLARIVPTLNAELPAFKLVNDKRIYTANKAVEEAKSFDADAVAAAALKALQDRVIAAQQALDAAATAVAIFDPQAAIDEAKALVARNLAQGKQAAAYAADFAATLTDPKGIYKELFDALDAEAVANPNDVSIQQLKQIKDGHVATAEASKAEIQKALASVDTEQKKAVPADAEIAEVSPAAVK